MLDPSAPIGTLGTDFFTTPRPLTVGNVANDLPIPSPPETTPTLEVQPLQPDVECQLTISMNASWDRGSIVLFFRPTRTTKSNPQPGNLFNEFQIQS